MRFQRVFFPAPTAFHRAWKSIFSAYINYEGFIHIKSRPRTISVSLYWEFQLLTANNYPHTKDLVKINPFLPIKCLSYTENCHALIFIYTAWLWQMIQKSKETFVSMYEMFFTLWSVTVKQCCGREARVKLGLGNSFWLTPASIWSASIIEKLHLAEVLLYRDIFNTGEAG